MGVFVFFNFFEEDSRMNEKMKRFFVAETIGDLSHQGSSVENVKIQQIHQTTIESVVVLEDIVRQIRCVRSRSFLETCRWVPSVRLIRITQETQTNDTAYDRLFTCSKNKHMEKFNSSLY